jgi:mannose-1-phosphate guanylyltransferase
MTVMREVETVRLGRPAAGDSPALQKIYARLKSVVMLGGAVRATAFSEGIDRSLLDLPLNKKERVLDRWAAEAQLLAVSAGLDRIALQVMLDGASLAPADRTMAADRVAIHVARDPFEFRGTGGVLHDVARDLHEDDYVLVASGAQLLAERLTDLVRALALRSADVAILGHRDGTPSGLMLLRCGVLRGISELGFVDLKEQALPAIARRHRVMVEHRQTAGLSVRTMRDYLTALRQDHQRQRGEELCQDPFAEDWHSEFSLVEEGAAVDPSARLFDTVVLEGGTVGAGAVLVRSVVCAGAVVKAGKRVVDQLVAPGNGTPRKHARESQGAQ